MLSPCLQTTLVNDAYYYDVLNCDRASTFTISIKTSIKTEVVETRYIASLQDLATQLLQAFFLGQSKHFAQSVVCRKVYQQAIPRRRK